MVAKEERNKRVKLNFGLSATVEETLILWDTLTNTSKSTLDFQRSLTTTAKTIMATTVTCVTKKVKDFKRRKNLKNTSITLKATI